MIISGPCGRSERKAKRRINLPVIFKVKFRLELIYYFQYVNFKYIPPGTQRYPQCREFVREFDDSAFAGQIIRPAVTGNITMPQYPCDTNIISVRHLVETSERVDRIQCFDGRLAIGKYGDF